MASYDDKAIKSKQLQRLMEKEIYDRLKGAVPESIAEFLCSLAERIKALESALAERNLGDVVADSLDAQTLKVGGTDVKTRQSAKTNPTASGSAISFVDSVTQNENGEMTATRKSVRSATTSQTGVVQLTDSHSSNSTTTAATPKNVKEAYDLASGKADPSSVVDSASYDSANHTIVFKHGSTQLFTLDAAAFVKDGMVDSVAISNGNLVITFNTDAGKQPISIPLTDIFNPNNYYTKTETNTLLGSKVDATDSRLLPDADVALILYGDSTYTNVKALYNAGKKLYLVTGGSIQPSGRFEYRIPLTLITYDANLEVNAFYFEQSQDDRAGASEVGSIAVYRLDSTGWTTTPKQVGYATNAGHAATADNATNATNDHGGAKIRDAYIHSVTSTASTTGYVDSFYSFDGASTTADANGFLNVTLSATQVQVATTRYKVAQGMAAMQKNGTDQMPNNVCKICLRADAYVAYGYNGFTCLGHEAPLASGQHYYGWFANLAQSGAVIEIDFDYIAYGEVAVAGAGNPPSYMKVSFAACTENNAFIYGFAIDKSSIFASAQETIWFVGEGGQVQGHVHMVGRGANATIQTGTRVFVGAVQTTSNGHYLVMQVSNINIKVTGGRIYDIPNLP